MACISYTMLFSTDITEYCEAIFDEQLKAYVRTCIKTCLFRLRL